MKNLNQLKFEYLGGKGRVDIDLDAFLPRNKKEFKKLLNLVELSEWHSKELKKQIEDFIIEKIPVFENEWKQTSKHYVNYQQYVNDISKVIETGKHSNGVPVCEAALKVYKSDLRYYKGLAKRTLQDVKQAKKALEQLNDHLKILKEGK